MIDIYNITTPFGLLDDETQEALRAHSDGGGKIEIYGETGWREFRPAFTKHTLYRAVKEPVRETKTHKLQVSQIGDFEPNFSEGQSGNIWFNGTATTETVDGKVVKITWVADQ